ncbi:MAG: helix-turn-helix transcriptional regulator [Nitrospirae bacterium]|nr:helix-turn-helix transcriptional regulator [Nitrospirota bacterium]
MTPDYGNSIERGSVASNLTSGDLLTMMEIIHQLTLCAFHNYTCCKAGIFSCINHKLRSMIPYDHIYFSVVKYNGELRIDKHPESIIILSPDDFGFPEGYIDELKEQKHYLNEPIIKRFLDEDHCYYWEDVYKQGPLGEIGILLRKYNLQKGYMSGQTDTSNNTLYYYTLAGQSLSNDRRCHIILTILTIYIRVIMSRMFSFTTAAAPNVSPRELEIVKLMSKGSTNQEISLTLQISVNTVKTHITSILKKLGAKNKTQAVALCSGYRVRDPGVSQRWWGVGQGRRLTQSGL